MAFKGITVVKSYTNRLQSDKWLLDLISSENFILKKCTSVIAQSVLSFMCNAPISWGSVLKVVMVTVMVESAGRALYRLGGNDHLEWCFIVPLVFSIIKEASQRTLQTGRYGQAYKA